MNINIEKYAQEKYAQAYKNFFQSVGMADKEKGNISQNICPVNYQKLNENQDGFFGYDKESNITDGTKELSASIAEENESIMDFLNSAIDTLKNLVTKEDYSAFAELGITADKEDMGILVTVYERIQIQLAAYGKENSSSLNVSQEKIDKVIKSPALASSMKMTESIDYIDDGAKEYMLKNNLEPTVKNVYMAVHAKEGALSGTEGASMPDEQWEQLLPQVEKFLEKNGIEADENSLGAAKWLLERDIPLTTDSLVKYIKLKEIEAPDARDMESVKANMVLANVFGEAFENAYMTEGWIDAEKAQEAVDIIQKADDGAAQYIADNDLTLNVANLKKYMDYIRGNSDNTPENYVKSERGKNVKNENDKSPNNDRSVGNNKENNRRRNQILNLLNQAKAVMTMAGAMIMEKLGVDVTYTDIEYMVKEIREEDNLYNSVFFNEPTDERVSGLTNVMEIMGQLTGLPVSAVGTVVESSEQFTVHNIYNEGIRQRLAYEKAGETYEAVGTQVRGDLGDSIKKAFGNADNLIEEAGLTANDVYSRAVRVLGYNSMEINRESILMMAEKTTEVDRVIKNITPKTASYLIENNINPLDENIETLNERLEQINAQIGADENEEYSKYLWKLEKTGAVTREERQAFIELYRAIKTIEKADTRAVGAVLSEGAALTLGNLLSAEKSRSKYGNSTTVNDNTGYYQGRLIKNKLSDILEGIHGGRGSVSPEKLLDEDIDKMWQTYASYDEQERVKALNNGYETYRLNEIFGDAAEYTEEMVYDLLDSGMAPSMENLSALSRLMKKNKDISAYFKNEINGEQKLLDSLEGEQEAAAGYKDLMNETLAIAEKEMETESIESLKYKGIYNVARFMAKAAENRCYHIPMDMDGEMVLVKVKFSHKGAKENNIKISANDKLTGKVEANITVSEGKLTGYIVCSNESLEKEFAEGVKEWQLTAAESIGERESYTDRQLYDVSKSFLKMLKDFGRLPINNVG